MHEIRLKLIKKVSFSRISCIFRDFPRDGESDAWEDCRCKMSQKNGEHHHVYRQKDDVAYSFHIALAESEGAGNGIFRVWHHSRQWKDRKLHISNTFPLIYYTFPTRFAHIPYTFPIFWCFHLLMLSSLQGLDFGIGSHYFHCIFVFLGVMQIYNVKIRLNSQLSV